MFKYVIQIIVGITILTVFGCYLLKYQSKWAIIFLGKQ